MSDPLKSVASAFNARIRQYGARPPGVLWRNAEGQQLRFELLASIFDGVRREEKVTVNDLGCGYGAFFKFFLTLDGPGLDAYYGYDIAKAMIAEAHNQIVDSRAFFEVNSTATRTAGYSVVSGTYNLILNADAASWEGYVKESLAALWERTEKGLAFNMLNAAQPEIRGGLYYTNPHPFADFCREELSPEVTLIDDYPLNEWTLLVRRKHGI